MKDTRYIIGIDLGTTNSALTYIDTKKNWDIHIFNVPQFVDDGRIKELPVLPSFVYINNEIETKEQIPFPWGKSDENPNYIVGELARNKGVLIPNRLVASAKSWLRHNKVDRKDKILPFGSDDNNKISPVAASSYYLKHLSDTWNYVMGEKEENQFNNQQIIITIPASFDETSRELTAEAAKMAGIIDFTMLEEPQAAFYCWMSRHTEDWNQFCNDGNIIFIIDIGGGTTDFNLITLTHTDGISPHFQRVAVGEHLLLGGDNMDIALARNVEAKITGNRSKLPLSQWLTLSHQCRTVKEELLSIKTGFGGETPNVETKTISVLGLGRSVIGGAIKIELSNKDVRENIVDGFFEQIDPFTDAPTAPRTGLIELGLPYVTEPNVMRHMSTFLKRHAVNPQLKQIKDPKTGQSMIKPDAVLFNGGVFKSKILRDCTIQNLNSWMSNGQDEIKILENDDLDLAVAIGAAYYGMVQRGRGMRISGGLGRAYYIGVEKAQKIEDKLIRTVCIIPKGFEEGQELILDKPEFQVMTNNPVSFALYSSAYRVGDKVGDVVTETNDSFTETAKVVTKLYYGKKGKSQNIPVNLGVRLNEFGTIDVWCQSKETTHKWKLSFQLRVEASAQDIVNQSNIISDSLVDEACALIEQTFMDAGAINMSLRNLISALTEIFDIDKTMWHMEGIRKMWDSLIKVKDRRLATPEHESRWLNLAGFLLRPGFGAAADDWRIEELWKIYSNGIKFSREQQCILEWWILWRRVAGGLTSVQQDIIYKKIAPDIISTKKSQVTVYREMLMLAASLEHLMPNIKAQIGGIILANIKKSKGNKVHQNALQGLGAQHPSPEKYLLWSLSRIGARSPFHGQINKVISHGIVTKWINDLLELQVESTAYCIASLAKKTDDRTRDISESLRDRIIEIFNKNNIDSNLVDQVSQFKEWQDKKTIFGESLPIGLFIEN
ncbi:MAG: Hsp70 family protein [Nitrospirae bacterium]|nr:Hsp70 family protein [Nitrospirota bacterium]MBF0540801.1 Hsp70 family protein [Nitrospirota bacterium]